MKSPDTHTDQLVHAAACAVETLEWTGFHLSADDAFNQREVEGDQLDHARRKLAAAVEVFDVYSDGRPVRAVVEVERGVRFAYVFPPTVEYRTERLLFERPMLRDPGARSRGKYRAYVHDGAGTVRVEIVPPLAALVVIR